MSYCHHMLFKLDGKIPFAYCVLIRRIELKVKKFMFYPCTAVANSCINEKLLSGVFHQLFLAANDQ